MHFIILEKKKKKKIDSEHCSDVIDVLEEHLRLYSETKLTLILDSNSSKYRSSVVGVGLTRV